VLLLLYELIGSLIIQPISFVLVTNLQSQDRRRWISPGGDTFASLPQAMKQVQKERVAVGILFPMLLPERKAAAAASSAISNAATSSNKDDGTGTGASTGKKKKGSTGGGQSKKRPASSQVTKASGGSTKSASKQPAKKKSRSKSPQPSGSAKAKSKGTASKGKQGKAAKTDPKYPPTPKIEEVIRPEPESDPETALDIVPIMRVDEKKKKKKKGSGKKSVSPVPVPVQSSKAVTVHWDPKSREGRRVGMRIRIFANDEGDDGEWREGRVLRYDPASNKHKIQYEDDIGDECCWLRLKNEIVQCGDDLVWCLVKGFAWWPAQILICEPATEMTTKEGCVYVKFFGADQVAFVKNVPDYVRPFNNGQIDSFIAKNKKKRNPKVSFLMSFGFMRTERIGHLF
jgi:hypothetical protein